MQSQSSTGQNMWFVRKRIITVKSDLKKVLRAVSPHFGFACHLHRKETTPHQVMVPSPNSYSLLYRLRRTLSGTFAHWITVVGGDPAVQIENSASHLVRSATDSSLERSSFPFPHYRSGKPLLLQGRNRMDHSHRGGVVEPGCQRRKQEQFGGRLWNQKDLWVRRGAAEVVQAQDLVMKLRLVMVLQ